MRRPTALPGDPRSAVEVAESALTPAQLYQLWSPAHTKVLAPSLEMRGLPGTSADLRICSRDGKQSPAISLLSSTLSSQVRPVSPGCSPASTLPLCNRRPSVPSSLPCRQKAMSTRIDRHECAGLQKRGACGRPSRAPRHPTTSESTFHRQILST